MHDLVTAGISRLRQTSQNANALTKARRTRKTGLHTVRACYTNASYQVSRSAKLIRTTTDWTSPSDPGRNIPAKETG